jgi:hypothetical protein
MLVACAPKAEPVIPTVDAMGTFSADLASRMMTQTAAAYSPTPPPATTTPAFTETPTLEPTPAGTAIPRVNKDAPCYKGPGATYPMISNISNTKMVQILGIGSVPGWYVIMNPYFYTPCWIAAQDLNLDPNFDPSPYPTITP